MKHVSVVLLILLSVGTAHSEDKPHNGYWWNDITETSKVWYIAGYAEFSAHFVDDAILKCVTAKNGGREPRPRTNEMFKYAGCPAPAEYDFTEIRFDQLKDGVNEFYKDFRNSAVNITFALAHVRDQLRGTKSAKQMDEELATYRRNAK